MKFMKKLVFYKVNYRIQGRTDIQSCKISQYTKQTRDSGKYEDYGRGKVDTSSERGYFSEKTLNIRKKIHIPFRTPHRHMSAGTPHAGSKARIEEKKQPKIRF